MNKKTTKKTSRKTVTKKASRKKSTRKANPLYVVTNNGKDVEKASGRFDAFIKKYGLGPVCDFLQLVMTIISDNINSYATLKAMRNYLDNTLAQFKGVVEYIDELSIPIIKAIRKVFAFA